MDWGLNPGIFALSAATSSFAHLEKFSLNFSNSSFVIRVNLFHPYTSFMLYALLLPFWRFSILVNYYFQISFNLKVIMCVTKLLKIL